MFKREANQRFKQTGLGCDPLVSTVDQQWITGVFIRTSTCSYITRHLQMATHSRPMLSVAAQGLHSTGRRTTHETTEEEHRYFGNDSSLLPRTSRGRDHRPGVIFRSGLDPRSTPATKDAIVFRRRASRIRCQRLQDIQLPGVVKADFLSSVPFGRGDGVEPRVAPSCLFIFNKPWI